MIATNAAAVLFIRHRPRSPRCTILLQWVTLWELNKMRRNEPRKVSLLWFVVLAASWSLPIFLTQPPVRYARYDQFVLDLNEFNRQAGPPGIILGLLLDRRPAIRVILCCTVLLAVGLLPSVRVTLPHNMAPVAMSCPDGNLQ